MLWKQSRRMAASGPGVSFLLHLHVHPLPAEAPAGVAYQEMSTAFMTQARGEFPAAWVYKSPLKMFLTCYVAQEFKMSCSQKSHRIFLSEASFEFTFRSFSALLSNFSAGESLHGRRGASCRVSTDVWREPCPMSITWSLSRAVHTTASDSKGQGWEILLGPRTQTPVGQWLVTSIKLGHNQTIWPYRVCTFCFIPTLLTSLVQRGQK